MNTPAQTLTNEQHASILVAYLARLPLVDAKKIFQALENSVYAGQNLGTSSQLAAHSALERAAQQAVEHMLPHDKHNIDICVSHARQNTEDGGPAPLRYWAITGRIPGDDEEVAYTFQAATREEALEAFEQSIWENKFDAEAGKEHVRKAHGQIVFVNAVLVSNSPICCG